MQVLDLVRILALKLEVNNLSLLSISVRLSWQRSCLETIEEHSAVLTDNRAARVLSLIKVVED